MLLDRHDTSSLNHLIARQIGCNSSKIRAQTILCRSISRESIKYDLVDSTFKIINNNNHNNNNDNTNNITGWSQQPPTHGSGSNQDAPGTEAIAATATTTTSPVYHIFYSTEYSDSIIYIMAILCIYFILFSLLIYANWTSFHHRRGLHQNNSKRRRRQKLSQQQLCKRNGFYLFQQPAPLLHGIPQSSQNKLWKRKNAKQKSSPSITQNNGNVRTASSSGSSSSISASGNSLLCRLMPPTNFDSLNNAGNGAGNIGGPDSVQVVFSAQSRDAIIYVTVVLVIYIIIFVVLVVTSYRKSSALRETLNRHLRSQYATGPFGTPTILETDTNGDQVHCDTVDELHEGSIQL